MQTLRIIKKIRPIYKLFRYVGTYTYLTSQFALCSNNNATLVKL